MLTVEKSLRIILRWYTHVIWTLFCNIQSKEPEILVVTLLLPVILYLKHAVLLASSFIFALLLRNVGYFHQISMRREYSWGGGRGNSTFSWLSVLLKVGYTSSGLSSRLALVLQCKVRWKCMNLGFSYVDSVCATRTSAALSACTHEAPPIGIVGATMMLLLPTGGKTQTSDDGRRRSILVAPDIMRPCHAFLSHTFPLITASEWPV